MTGLGWLKRWVGEFKSFEAIIWPEGRPSSNLPPMPRPPKNPIITPAPPRPKVRAMGNINCPYCGRQFQLIGIRCQDQ